MRKWNLTSNDPGCYSLAADIRFGPTDYPNDHIWELNLEGGEPPALALVTTYGLRARNMQLFPRFLEGDNALSNPADFSEPVTVRSFAPNYLSVRFSPFLGIDVVIEYWVPESHAIAGRLRVTNNRLSPRQVRVEWAAMLAPASEGQRMAAIELNAVTVLAGKTGGLCPVVFMTGGPAVSSGPFPALASDLTLSPGSARQLTWVQAALESPEASFSLAREIASRDWEAEFARIEVRNSAAVEIETGDSDWDAALALAQKTALGLFVGPGRHLPYPSFVFSRQRDHGFSPGGDGRDYNHLWNGQSALEAVFLTSLFLPDAPELAKGLLLNFLETQSRSGFVDWKPGLAGQRGRMMATPVLAQLAWQIYQADEDKQFLAQVFPGLMAFIQGWFGSDQDRDGDGLPEWSHAMQTGFEDHPTFSNWHAGAQGVDITKVESPALCAFLYHEIKLLLRMARILERSEPILALESLADNLKTAVETAWDETQACYHHWDRETHISPAGEILGERLGAGEIQLLRQFAQPVRVTCKIEAQAAQSRSAAITIHGVSASGRHRVEQISPDSIQWFMGAGSVTSERAYTGIEHITVGEVGEHDRTLVQIVDLDSLDQSLLLPLWAAIPPRHRAYEFLEKTVLDPEKFWKSHGLSACPFSDEEGSPKYEPGRNIHIHWNSLIGAGLLHYDYREQAAELVTRIMGAVIQSLKKRKSFYQYYDAETGAGKGERNALQGLAPIDLFMETVGVRVISATCVALSGKNPFPWPVTIRYRGLTIVREKKHTRISFPGGQAAIVRSSDPRIVQLSPTEPTPIE